MERPFTFNRRTLLATAGALVATPSVAQSGRSPSRVEILMGDEETAADEPRVRVWVPPGYDDSDASYPVLYMLDGQWAFAQDADGFNFSVDRRVAALAEVQTIRPHLVVAIDNLDRYRFLQYMPQAIYDLSDGALRTSIDREIARTGGRPLVSARFINFVTTRLKALVDTRYRTLPDGLDTAIFGASMAGVMSGALFVEGQQVFGRCACMSPNWAIYDADMVDHPQLLTIWPDYFAQLGVPAGRRLWLDHGTQMMDAGMAPHQLAISQTLTDLGWQRGCNLQTRVYEAGHAFAQTAVQMDEVLAWLLA